MCLTLSLTVVTYQKTKQCLDTNRTTTYQSYEKPDEFIELFLCFGQFGSIKIHILFMFETPKKINVTQHSMFRGQKKAGKSTFSMENQM